MPAKEWVLVIGIAVILLAALGSVQEESSRYGASGVPRGRLLGIQAGYAAAIIDLVCVVAFLDWRRGLVGLGVPDALSWVLAPAGLIAVIAAGMVAWSTAYGEYERVHWSKSLGAGILYFAAAGGYLTVARAHWS